LESQKEYDLPLNNKDIFSMKASRDHRLLGVIEIIRDNNGKVTGSDLRVFNARGQAYLSRSLQNKVLQILGWLDDQSVVLQGTRDDGTVIIFNPFTAEQQELRPVFYDFYQGDPPPYWFPTYNPTLTRVVYPNGHYFKGVGYVLMDVQSGRVLWQYPFDSAPYVAAQWSPDGKQFAVAAEVNQARHNSPGFQEFFVVSEDGQVTVQTHLTDVYAAVYIGHFSWSPNGKQIALWLSVIDNSADPSSENYHFAILDISTGQLTDYCVQNQFGSPAPVWSPDGQQLIVENQLGNDVVVDPQKGVAALLSEDMSVFDWMTSVEPESILTPTPVP
jgi:WD40 repeat protein